MNDKLFRDAQQALSALYSDASVPVETTAEKLTIIRDNIEMMIDALKIDED